MYASKKIQRYRERERKSKEERTSEYRRKQQRKITKRQIEFSVLPISQQQKKKIPEYNENQTELLILLALLVNGLFFCITYTHNSHNIRG